MPLCEDCVVGSFADGEEFLQRPADCRHLIA